MCCGMMGVAAIGLHNRRREGMSDQDDRRRQDSR
jgi:hypothetical protein